MILIAILSKVTKDETLLLDTSIVSYFLAMHPSVKAKVIADPVNALCTSVMTEGELRFSLAKRPQTEKLHLIVQSFLRQIDVLSWDCKAPKHYGILRILITRKGATSAPPFGLLIAAHALSVGTVFHRIQWSTNTGLDSS
jgi:tRNA(fMet)-specific endonuclease VapC